MTPVVPDVERIAAAIVWTAVALAIGAYAALVIERAASSWVDLRSRRIHRRYAPLVERALAGDGAAVRVLQASPSRHRLSVAALIVLPLIDDRDPVRIERSRDLMRQLDLFAIADRFLRSRFWWRRATALRALGLLQAEERTGEIVAALDDPNIDVRGAALDALADLRNPASLEAVVVRLMDSSLHRGRRIAALGAFGAAAEPMLLEIARLMSPFRVSFAGALGICGTVRCRATLCEWTADTRAEVRAAAFNALTRVGLDADAARLATAALESQEASVRAAAAGALNGWTGDRDAAAHLARHLVDVWPVASRAAQSLRSMGDAGASELRATADRSDLAGVLARQMLWEARV